MSRLYIPTTTAITQAAGDNTTLLATDAFVTTAVNNAIAGVNPAVAVQAATAAVLPNSPTYSNGVSGVGATLTAGSTNVTLVVDGYTPTLNQRILVKNQASAFQNGVYTVTQLAALGLGWVLTRALDYDTPSDMNNTGAIPVVNGTANASTSWVQTSQVTTVGTDAVTFTEFTLNPTTLMTTTTYDPAAIAQQVVGTTATQTITNKTVDATSPTAFNIPGMLVPYAGFTAPTGWLLTYGQAVSRTTYASLFAIIVPSVGNPTITIASPGVLTLNAHGFQNGDPVYLTTTGALPTGFSANTIYYVVSKATNTFQLAATRGGAAINTSGSQSGTHTVYFCPYGLGDGSTTFNIPDLRGHAALGNDSMGGTAANVLSNQALNGIYGNMGAVGGEPTHTMTTSELVGHTHSVGDGSGFVAGGAGGAPASITQAASAFRIFTNTTSTGSGSASNLIQPSIIVNYIIKT